MVHAVHDTIAIRTQVIGTLEKPGEYVKDLFGGLAHRERMMRCIAMKEECLEE
jgi:hypothetical protein